MAFREKCHVNHRRFPMLYIFILLLTVTDVPDQMAWLCSKNVLGTYTAQSPGWTSLGKEIWGGQKQYGGELWNPN